MFRRYDYKNKIRPTEYNYSGGLPFGGYNGLAFLFRKDTSKKGIIVLIDPHNDTMGMVTLNKRDTYVLLGEMCDRERKTFGFIQEYYRRSQVLYSMFIPYFTTEELKDVGYVVELRVDNITDEYKALLKMYNNDIDRVFEVAISNVHRIANPVYHMY